MHVGLAISCILTAPSTSEYVEDRKCSDRGTRFSSSGPAPLPESGSILDDPELLWAEVRCAPLVIAALI